MQQVRPSVYNLPQNPMNHRSYKCNYIKARVETVRMDFVRSQNQNQNFKVQPSGGGNASFNTTAGAGDTNLYGGGITANQDLLSGSMLSTGGLQPSARAAAGTAVDQRAATATTAADGSITGELINTKRSVILAFNSYLYLIHCILTFLVLLGATGILWPFCVCGSCGHCFSGCAHLAAVIVTGVFRFSSEGELCSKQVLAVDTDGTTFEDMGEQIKSLFIA